MKLKLNAFKTVFLLCSRRRVNLPTLHLTINGTNIAPSQEASFLGLVIDSHLRWTSHIKSKCVASKRALLSCRTASVKLGDVILIDFAFSILLR